MPVNSHVQIPKSILKDFSSHEVEITDKGPSQHNYVYSLNMDGSITKSDIKDCNTIFGYYEDKVEKEIIKKYEDLIGNIKTNIFSLHKKGKITLKKSDSDVVKSFLTTIFLRSPERVKLYCENSTTWFLFATSPQNQLLYEYEKRKELFNKFFDGYNINIFQNKTKINFIIPQVCFYDILLSPNKEVMFVFPISPGIAIVLIKNIEKYIDADGVLLHQITTDERVIDRFNKNAIYAEYMYNKQNVYAKNREDLERYSDFITSLNNGEHVQF